MIDILNEHLKSPRIYQTEKELNVLLKYHSIEILKYNYIFET